MFFLNGALFGSWASRIPAFKDKFALDDASLGMLLLCLAAGAIVSFPLTGRWVDSAGAAPVTRRCAAVYVSLTPMLALAPTPLLLALVVFLFGAAHGAMDVAMNAWGGEVEKAQRHWRPILPRLHGLFSVGAGVGAGTGALFARAELDPVIHFFAFAAVCGVVTLALARTSWSSSHGRIARPATPWIVMPRGALLAVGLVALAAAVGEGAMADWSAVYLTDALDAPPPQAAMGYAVFSLSMVAVRLWGGVLITRVGPANTARRCGVVVAMGATMLVLAPTVWMGWLGMAVLGLGYSLIMPLAFSRAAVDPLVAPGAAMAAVSTLSYGGMLLGPPLIGFIAQATNLRAALALLAVLAMVIIVLSRSLATTAPPSR